MYSAISAAAFLQPSLHSVAALLPMDPGGHLWLAGAPALLAVAVFSPAAPGQRHAVTSVGGKQSPQVFSGATSAAENGSYCRRFLKSRPLGVPEN
ncbi:MAG: hypothetical protein INR66_00635 [Gordonia polyisoprenivorans]|nr:hypothetical protein [Gordonia polyisoprenivorans]